jgi:hypothetical protein
MATPSSGKFPMAHLSQSPALEKHCSMPSWRGEADRRHHDEPLAVVATPGVL